MANATSINLRQQQVKGDGRHVVIGQLLVEIWGITCVGAEQVESNELDRKCPKNRTQANELTEKKQPLICGNNRQMMVVGTW